MDTTYATFSFGLGLSGQLGLGSGEERNTSEPTLVPGLVGKGIKGISCGDAHVACLTGRCFTRRITTDRGRWRRGLHLWIQWTRAVGQKQKSGSSYCGRSFRKFGNSTNKLWSISHHWYKNLVPTSTLQSSLLIIMFTHLEGTIRVNLEFLRRTASQAWNLFLSNLSQGTTLWRFIDACCLQVDTADSLWFKSCSGIGR